MSNFFCIFSITRQFSRPVKKIFFCIFVNEILKFKSLTFGNIGFGKLHLSHLCNIGSLLTTSIALSIGEKYFHNFVSDSQTNSKNGVLWKDHDTARTLAADFQVTLWSLDSMIRQIVLSWVANWRPQIFKRFLTENFDF